MREHSFEPARIHRFAQSEIFDARLEMLPIGVDRADHRAVSEDGETVRFQDALGRVFDIPHEKCNTWAAMESIISAAFAHLDVLGPQVQEVHYDLVNAAGDSIVPAVWEQAVTAGSFVTMHMWPMHKAGLRGPPSPYDRWAWVTEVGGTAASAAAGAASTAAVAAGEAWKRLPSRQEVASWNWPKISIELPKRGDKAPSPATTPAADAAPMDSDDKGKRDDKPTDKEATADGDVNGTARQEETAQQGPQEPQPAAISAT